MATNSPRVVFVTRETDYELLLARHATREQARFFLKTRGQKLSDVEARHDRFRMVLQGCRATVPVDWRQALVKRSDFNRFLFGPEDFIVAVGQDGLVANVAKYLAGQPVLGVNPDPSQYDGLLVKLSPDRLGGHLQQVVAGAAPLEHRTMAEARIDGGGRLLALNEIFVGHRSHQSARYEIEVDGKREAQSSSGLIVSSGTGATGWARSIMEATATRLELAPGDHVLGYFVREPFPSIASGTSIRAGVIVEGKALVVTSRLNDGGAIFADGIEQDFLTFDWGRRVEVRVAKETLNLVIG
jgi:NAD kinase